MPDEGTPVDNRTQLDSGLDAPAATLVRALESIPMENECAKPLDSLFADAGMNTPETQTIATIFEAFLRPFGVLSITQGNDGVLLVQASTRPAMYFLRSLAAYIREERDIFVDWGRHASPEDKHPSRNMLRGPYFLHLIERQRSLDRRDVIPLRQTEVAQAIIKCRVRGRRGASYLMQFDRPAGMFQLIGGHRRQQDRDLATTVRRELEEELPRNHFNFANSEELHHLGDVEATLLSRTVGVNTLYRFSFFRLESQLHQITLGPADRWVTYEELIAGRTNDGITVGNSNIVALERELGRRLVDLSFSLRDAQERKIREILKEHPWEAAGLLVAILGLILSIAFFLLQGV